MRNDPRIQRIMSLLSDAFAAPPGVRRVTIALLAGILCHSIFAAAVLSMMYAMFYGLRTGLGEVPHPWHYLANVLLVVQFPLAHSLLLTAVGRRFLTKLAPAGYGIALSTTNYAIIASVQLLTLFWLWTPSGAVWWEAEGPMFALICMAYTGSWLLLIKAIFDAGAELQSGALGWLSLLADKAPKFPDLPTLGLFRYLRQPIYLAFALTLWTVPVWTPDQMILAVLWTGYCIGAPMLKERRLAKQFGKRFYAYQQRTPYMIPRVQSGRGRVETAK